MITKKRYKELLQTPVNRSMEAALGGSHCTMPRREKVMGGGPGPIESGSDHDDT